MADYGYPVVGGMDQLQYLIQQLQQEFLRQQLDWQRQVQGSGISGYYKTNPNGTLSWSPAGGTPTFEREQYQTNASGYMNGAPTLSREQMYLNALASTSGPQNWLKHNAILQQGARTNSLGQNATMFGGPAWGAVSATPSYENALAGWPTGGTGQNYGGPGPVNYQMEAGEGGGRVPAPANTSQTPAAATTPQYAVVQPHMIKAQEYNQMTPSQREMQSGLWSSQGLDPNDMWTRMKRAQPTGTAASGTRWM